MKKKHYLLLLLASLFLLTDVVWAQTSATVSGVVIDENGETLPGVSVVEVGTTNSSLNLIAIDSPVFFGKIDDIYCKDWHYPNLLSSTTFAILLLK